MTAEIDLLRIKKDILRTVDRAINHSYWLGCCIGFANGLLWATAMFATPGSPFHYVWLGGAVLVGALFAIKAAYYTYAK